MYQPASAHQALAWPHCAGASLAKQEQVPTEKVHATSITDVQMGSGNRAARVQSTEAGIEAGVGRRGEGRCEEGGKD